MKACKDCYRLFDNDSKCPMCGAETSKEWQGYVIVVEHQHSEIAKRIGVKENGKFALKVR